MDRSIHGRLCQNHGDSFIVHAGYKFSYIFCYVDLVRQHAGDDFLPLPVVVASDELEKCGRIFLFHGIIHLAHNRQGRQRIETSQLYSGHGNCNCLFHGEIIDFKTVLFRQLGSCEKRLEFTIHHLIRLHGNNLTRSHQLSRVHETIGANIQINLWFVVTLFCNIIFWPCKVGLFQKKLKVVLELGNIERQLRHHVTTAGIHQRLVRRQTKFVRSCTKDVNAHPSL
mmetsp:Transcript_60863/g.91907  ORF Transcript_60863/g.91907 Transcript_60863/m.91907 type:complete len:226 (-) Transcript_60863:317-994(-)